MPTNKFSHVEFFTSGLSPNTAATKRPRSGSEPVRVFWSSPTYASGGNPAGRAPMPISSLPLFLTAAGSSALMDLTSETLMVVWLAAPLETASDDGLAGLGGFGGGGRVAVAPAGGEPGGQGGDGGRRGDAAYQAASGELGRHGRSLSLKVMRVAGGRPWGAAGQRTLLRKSLVRSCRGLSRTSAGGPCSTILPPSMKTTRSAISRAKPISWVTMTRVVPLVARSLMTARTSPTSSGSRAEVGSSKRMTPGRRARARAMATRCCWPPES